MAHPLLVQFLYDLIHFLVATEFGSGQILAVVLAVLVAAFAASVVFVGGAGGFAALAILPPSFNTAYISMNLALLFLGLLLMFLSVSVSVSRGAVPPSPQHPSTAAAEFLLSRALNVSIAAVFLSACVLIHLLDAEQ